MFQQFSKEMDSHRFWKALLQKEDFMNFSENIFKGELYVGLLENFFNDVKSHDLKKKKNHFHRV